MQPLAEARRILDLVAEEVRRAGVVGAAHPAKLIYLVVCTRVFERPVSMAIKGQSSSGKSYPLDAVLKLFPEHAYYALTAMSEHALAYSEESLRHRILVVYEAAGLGGFRAQYFIRSLLSEGRVAYETVESTPKAGLKCRRIDREGPTGLVLTTTRLVLHPEIETRLLSMTVDDSPDQTSAVFAGLAQSHGQVAEPADYTAWHRFQKRFEREDSRVVVPYATALLSSIPPVSVRLRRDARMLLTLIQAHAKLHRARRQRDPSGAIVADPDDYAAVYELVHDLVAEAVDHAVPERVREAVEIVRDLISDGATTVRVTAVAEGLGVDKSTAWRAVQVAIRLGHLVNLEVRRSRPARLGLGEPLPADRTVLPRPEDLFDATGCTVAGISKGRGKGAPDDAAPRRPERGTKGPLPARRLCRRCRAELPHEWGVVKCRRCGREACFTPLHLMGDV
jgi:hypothetical protein